MIDDILVHAEEHMQKAVASLGDNFGAVRTGRASALVLDRIKVDYYGVMTPINQMAAIKTPDAHMLLIEPWEKSSLSAITQAIQSSDLGVTPSNDGSVIRLPFPQPTEERRRELVKQCKVYAEESRVSVRNARRDANTAIEKLKKDSQVSEDDAKRGEADCQKLTDKYIAEIDEVFKKKEAEVMEI
ncbi:MAG: ribosome recycling factor [Eggerthellaceae bacterium]|jgi:ribosome recycling factor|nr:ribosome recycling factor [Eggerthellaceae bacterium]MDR2716223.1 ribosome recycling factor [Coriobacteriaceae bacterium]